MQTPPKPQRRRRREGDLEARTQRLASDLRPQRREGEAVQDVVGDDHETIDLARQGLEGGLEEIVEERRRGEGLASVAPREESDEHRHHHLQAGPVGNTVDGGARAGRDGDPGPAPVLSQKVAREACLEGNEGFLRAEP
jgi:hypothetical protein